MTCTSEAELKAAKFHIGPNLGFSLFEFLLQDIDFSNYWLGDLLIFDREESRVSMIFVFQGKGKGKGKGDQY